jgi:hypothetical protein
VAILSTISGLNPLLQLAAIILLAAILVIVGFSAFYEMRSRRRSRRHYRPHVIYYY